MTLRKEDKMNANVVDGTTALTAIKEKLKHQHGEDFDISYKMATMEREIFDMIAELRKQEKITQSMLASSLKIKQQQLSKYETLQQSPTLSVFLKLCEEMGLVMELKTKKEETVLFHT